MPWSSLAPKLRQLLKESDGNLHRVDKSHKVLDENLDNLIN